MIGVEIFRMTAEFADFLEKNKIIYDYVDIDLLEKKERKATMKELRLINPKGSLPTIQIGDQVVVGFKEEEITEALEK